MPQPLSRPVLLPVHSGQRAWRGVAGAAMVVATVVVGVAQSADVPRPIVHMNPSVADEFLACASRVLGRPVLAATGTTGDDAAWLASPPRCSGSAEELTAAMGAADLNVVAADDWLVAYPAGWHDAKPSAVSATHPQWATVRVVRDIQDWATEGGRKLTAHELEAVSEGVVAHARPPIVHHVPVGPSGDATITLSMFAEAVRFGPREPESIVVAYGRGVGPARLVVGRLVVGRFVPSWDSPLVTIDSLGYYDLDGDGQDEITVRASRDRHWEFTGFTARGMEITRQSSCPPWTGEMRDRRAPDAGYGGGGFACPITGHEDAPLELEPRADGKIDLLGGVWRVARGGSRLVPQRFTLQRGVYVEQGRAMIPRWPRQ